jgi:hypothetical protein
MEIRTPRWASGRRLRMAVCGILVLVHRHDETSSVNADHLLVVRRDCLSPVHNRLSTLRADHSHPSIHARSSVSVADITRLMIIA